MEKSSIEILTDFAKKNNYQYWSNIQSNSSIIPNRGTLINTKFFILKYPAGANSYYFCASDKGAHATIYSGLFANYSKKRTSELKVTPKLWFDRLTFNRKTKTGISELDKKLSIVCSSDKLVKAVVSPRVGNEFIQLCKKLSPIELVIEDNYLSYNPELEGKSILGLKTNRWITEEKELQIFLDQGSNLLDLAKKN